MKRLGQWLMLISFLSAVFASPPGGPPPLPKANAEATEKLKAAYAAYVQGQYQRAIQLALEVYQKHGDVEAKWFPSWVSRFVKEPLPDPYDKNQVLSKTIGSFETSRPFLYTMAICNAFPSYLLAFSYAALGNFKETSKWADALRKSRREQEVMLAFSHYAYCRRLGMHQPMPPQTTWRPLPLRFREEDYFVLVPLDEACKVLGISFRLDISPKTKRIRYVLLGEKGKIGPGLLQARNLKGEWEHMAYAPYEEDGEVWVPFYWLAKQVGIRWWEVRNGKIYVAPKQPRERLNPSNRLNVGNRKHP